ncbi:MAG: hypothetical protein PHY09_05680 [Desulfuromonadaceae bacterium]|nr:hypothetical protein [Desulfuromonadaceae bacterium]MDD5107256.1 hypothetical protein [Desulfuromonadaceae bacterium]
MWPTLARITRVSSILAATAVPALATAESRGSSSEPLVWGFLGLCSLIVIAQIIPVIGLFKKQSEEVAKQPKAVKAEQL